jgi:hypothetical protein
MNFLKTLLDNLWASLLLAGGGLWLSAHADAVRAVWERAGHDPLGALGLLLAGLGAIGATHHVMRRQRQTETKEFISQCVQGVAVFGLRLLQEYELLPQLQDADAKARLREMHTDLAKLRADTARLLERI